MTKSIRYGEATCDVCGRVIRFNDNNTLPEDWVFYNIMGEDKRDVCDRCNKAVHELMSQLRENEKKNNNQNGEGRGNSGRSRRIVS